LVENKFDYIISHFKTIYGVDFSVDVNHGIDNKSKIQIAKCDDGFFDGDDSHPQNVIWKEWESRNIPLFFAENDNLDIVNCDDDQVIISYDIISSAFYLLSGWQEYKSAEREAELGRFPYNKSIQFELGIAEIPVVNYYFDILKKAIEKAYNISLQVKMWGNSSFNTFISHDIDICESGWKEAGIWELRKGRPFSTFKLVLMKVFGKDHWFNFDRMINIEKKYGAKSTYFFLCVNTKAKNLPNSDYNISDEKFQGVFDKILGYNSEIGIHGSLGTSNDLEMLKSERGMINRDIIGNRFHFLDYDIHHTPALLEEFGVKYDASLGFFEHIGFRHSFCFPFFPYDFINDRPFKFLEVPLFVMDNSMENLNFMGISQEESLEKIKELATEVKKFNGCFSLLWHNNYFSDYKFKGWKEVFEQSLLFLSDEGSSFKTGAEIFDIFVQQHDQV